jgi:hypothetical protein
MWHCDLVMEHVVVFVYIYIYINAVADSIMLYLQHDL